MGILLAEAALKDGSARNAGGVVGRERRLHEAMGGHDDLFLIIHRHKRRERTEEIGLTRQRDGGGFAKFEIFVAERLAQGCNNVRGVAAGAPKPIGGG